ncbi:MAG: TatD family hydrolase [Methanobacteriaceae archaeon]|nr:TatD family hydrolase [Methanobacteriaceae archaeon]
MIDTHCHIDFKEYDEDREEVIKRAQDKLSAVINSGTNKIDNQRILDFSKEYEGFIYPSFGFHPVSSQKSSQEEIDAAKAHLIEHIDEIVAVGEVGMDFFYCKDKALRERQREVFTDFATIANDYKVPLLIHGRDCERKIFNMLSDYPDIPKVVFHCYGGSLKIAKRILDEDDYYLSFSTLLCFSQHHQELVKEIPLDRILTETDSPYFAMTKEERNEPVNVEYAVKKIAEIKNLDISTVDEVTDKNARYVFDL